MPDGSMRLVAEEFYETAAVELGLDQADDQLRRTVHAILDLAEGRARCAIEQERAKLLTLDAFDDRHYVAEDGVHAAEQAIIAAWPDLANDRVYVEQLATTALDAAWAVNHKRQADRKPLVDELRDTKVECARLKGEVGRLVAEIHTLRHPPGGPDATVVDLDRWPGGTPAPTRPAAEPPTPVEGQHPTVSAARNALLTGGYITGYGDAGDPEADRREAESLPPALAAAFHWAEDRRNWHTFRSYADLAAQIDATIPKAPEADR